MAKILLVEDDVGLAEVIRFGLTSQGHIVQVVHGGPDAGDNLAINKYDIVILDWMLPERSGIDVLKQFRGAGGKTPVLMLTAKALLDNKEAGLDSGADDYMTKPFEQRELHARIRALLRRPGSITGSLLLADGIELDPVTCTVCKNGEPVHLRPKVYSLLEFLMRHPNQIFSADALLERVWLDESLVTVDTVRAHFKLLRRSLQLSQGELVKTVKKRGYMLVTEKIKS
jgi:two-component system, OmpR family, phosphate regulon response regulator PhoB